VYNKGLKTHSEFLTLTFVKGKNLKIGFSVPNKVGKAVVRAKLKRRLRAITRPLIKNLVTAQIVIAAKKGAEELKFDDLKAIVLKLLKKALLLKE